MWSYERKHLMPTSRKVYLLMLFDVFIKIFFKGGVVNEPYQGARPLVLGFIVCGLVPHLHTLGYVMRL